MWRQAVGLFTEEQPGLRGAWKAPTGPARDKFSTTGPHVLPVRLRADEELLPVCRFRGATAAEMLAG